MDVDDIVDRILEVLCSKNKHVVVFDSFRYYSHRGRFIPSYRICRRGDKKFDEWFDTKIDLVVGVFGPETPRNVLKDELEYYIGRRDEKNAKFKQR